MAEGVEVVLTVAGEGVVAMVAVGVMVVFGE